MGGLSPYLQKYLQNKRSNLGYSYGITLWTIGTGAGWSADDAYRRPSSGNWVPTLNIFTGAVGFGSWRGRTDTTGGYYQTSDVTIVASDSWKDKISSERTKIQLESGAGTIGVFYRADRIVDCPDTDEIVVYASRIQE